jgi:hypothetical protein
MDDGRGPNGGQYGQYGAPYEDPRYAPQDDDAPFYDDDDDDGPDQDMPRPRNYSDDGPPPSNKYSRAPPRYSAPPPDDDDGRDYGTPPPGKYSKAPPRYAAPLPGKACARSEQVRERLTREGWRDFHAGQPVNDAVVTLRARRPNGRLFELTLDRCSGELVEARPLQLRPFGPFAFQQPYGPYRRPWRWRPETGQYGYVEPWVEERPNIYRDSRRW